MKITLDHATGWYAVETTTGVRVMLFRRFYEALLFVARWKIHKAIDIRCARFAGGTQVRRAVGQRYKNGRIPK